MPLKNRTGVEILMLKDLTSIEIDRVAHELRKEPPFAMSVEEALAELRQAEREQRLLIEWKGGWLYFFYGPHYYNDTDADFAGIDLREFLTRVPRPKGRRRREPRAEIPL